MTNSAGRPVFQQNALRQAGGNHYRPAGQWEDEIGPVGRYFEYAGPRDSSVPNEPP